MQQDMHVNMKMDADLYWAVSEYARSHAITLSAAIRDLLRRSLGTVSNEVDAGWREGYLSAFNTVRRLVAEAILNMKPVTLRRKQT